MKLILLLCYPLCLGILTSCVQSTPSEKQQKSVETVSSTYNSYELIRIGKYECVGMDGYKSGGVWCNKVEQ